METASRKTCRLLSINLENSISHHKHRNLSKGAIKLLSLILYFIVHSIYSYIVSPSDRSSFSLCSSRQRSPESLFMLRKLFSHLSVKPEQVRQASQF